jgi:hypothetical protein
MSGLLLQMSLGIALRTFNVVGSRSQLIRRVRLSHQILGYLVTILCKINYYIILDPA